jgi:hypothetical protein
LDPVVREHEIAARRELHLDPVVHEREIAALQEIHETEQLDPVVRERENAANAAERVIKLRSKYADLKDNFT